MKLVAVIMAGGSGTRFWPLSRSSRPKQFLPIAGQKTMFEETVERLLPLLPLENIYTVSGEAQAKMIKELVPQLSKENILVEPQARNTAPSLLLATARVFLEDPTAVVAALPADHVILKPEIFRRKLKAAAAAAADGFLVTFGIPPTYPATAYGYIHYDRNSSVSFEAEPFFHVLSFKEKPDRPLAEKFLASGEYYWNSGMFLWRADAFVSKLEAYAAEWYGYFREILGCLEAKDETRLASVFGHLPVLSIDYALMEKAKGILVCPGDFGWSDVGVWSSLFDLWPKDQADNATRGETVALNARRCLVYNPGKLTALVGAEDLIIVNTESALLVCRRQDDQKLREIIEWLKKSGREEYL